MSWSILDFSKHEGKSLPQVLFSDPDWFFWAYDKGVLHDRSGELQYEAEVLFQRARRMLIPKRFGSGKKVEYYAQPVTGGFANLHVVDADQTEHAGASRTTTRPYFDLSIPYQMKKYDKRGAALLIKHLKFYLFGDKDIRLTRSLCEDFFDDDSHFAA